MRYILARLYSIIEHVYKYFYQFNYAISGFECILEQRAFNSSLDFLAAS